MHYQLNKLHSLEEASKTIFNLLSENIGVNTFFIAKNDGHTVDILEALNRDYTLLENGFQIDFQKSFWILIVKSGRGPLVIPDLNKSELTKDMEVTKAFGGGCLIGVPIQFKNGKKFGTLCGMDNKPHDFTEKDIQLFSHLASLITYVLELDDSYKQILTLSAPIVPICNGVASLPIIGKVGKERAEEITRVALTESQRLELEHLVINLSGIKEIDEQETERILTLVKVLEAVGVNIIFAGMRPELARKTLLIQNDLKDVTFCRDIKDALASIGIKYVKNDGEHSYMM